MAFERGVPVAILLAGLSVVLPAQAQAASIAEWAGCGESLIGSHRSQQSFGFGVVWPKPGRIQGVFDSACSSMRCTYFAGMA